MPYDSMMLAAVRAELSDRVLGDRVLAVHQPDPLTVVLTFSRKQRLLLCADPEYARIHLVRRTTPRSGPPPSFCLLLRKYLEGVRLRDLNQPQFDRVLEIGFGAGEERVALVIEVMGRHSSMVLRGADDVLKGVIKHVPRSVNRYREIAGGCLYFPPPRGERVSPLEGPVDKAVDALLERAGDGALGAALSASWMGMSPVLVDWLAEKAGLQKTSVIPDDAASRAPFHAALLSALGALRRIVETEAFEPSVRIVGGMQRRDVWPLPFPGDPSSTMSGESISVLLEEIYRERMELRDQELIRSQAVGGLKSAIRKEKRKKEEFDRVIQEGSRAGELRRWGQALLTYPSRVEAGSSLVILPDPETESVDLSIPVDPDEGAIENAERYFRQARQSERSARHVEEMARVTAERLAAMEAADGAIRSADTLDELRRIVAAVPPEWGLPASSSMGVRGVPGQRGEPTKQKVSQPTFPPGIRRVLAASGHEILYGRSSGDNDVLTTRIARPNDLWLHVRGESSAHVVIRTNNRPDQVPRETVLQAANLAAIHSASKHSSYVPVDYTLRKYVVKRRGSPPGAVEYRSEKTVHVQPEQRHDAG